MSIMSVEVGQPVRCHSYMRLFEDPLAGGSVVDIENDVESCWNHFPRGGEADFVRMFKGWD